MAEGIHLNLAFFCPPSWEQNFATGSNNDHSRNHLVRSEKLYLFFTKEWLLYSNGHITIRRELPPSRVFTSMCPPGYGNKLIRSDCAAFCRRWEGGKNWYLYILNNTALLPWPFVHFLFTVHVITLSHKAERGKKKWSWMLMGSCDESVLTITICWAPTVCLVLSYMMGMQLWTHLTL